MRFVLNTSDLAFYSPGGELRMEPGDFEAWIAPDSASGEMVKFRVLK